MLPAERNEREARVGEVGGVLQNEPVDMSGELFCQEDHSFVSEKPATFSTRPPQAGADS